MGRINRTSILSGMLVGIGVIINTFSQNKYIGAMLFSFALLTIIQLQLQLYTGQIGFFTEKRYKIKEYCFMLVLNFIGASLSTFLALITRSETDINYIIEVSKTKFSHTYFELFICGLLCGVLMFIAVYCKNTIITIFCIMIFILSGYEHCVADFPFILLNISFENIVKFLLIVTGNSIGSIIAYYLKDYRNILIV